MEQEQLNAIKLRYRLLCAVIQHYNFYYFVKSQSLVTDATYDLLYDELEALEDEYGSQLDMSNSPTRTLKSQIGNDKTITIPHLIPALSIKKVSQEDLVLKYCEKYSQYDLIVQPKIDGVAISLTYQYGQLLYATTRGDGNKGQVITQHALHVPSIPIAIPDKSLIVLRGELYLNNHAKNTIRQLYKQYKAEEGRNIISGLMMSIEPNTGVTSLINFAVYQIYFTEQQVYKNDIQQLNAVNSWGINTINTLQYDKTKTIEHYKSQLIPHDVICDGLVFKINDLFARQQLGSTSTYHRWMLAFKFSTNIYSSNIIDLKLSLGRSGVLTPVAYIEPVDISGTKINKLTLHNADFVNKHKINIGSIIFFKRAGGVIPSVVDIVNLETNIAFNEIICPKCNQPGYKQGVNWFCINTNCVGKLLATMTHLASKACLDVRGLSAKTLEQLIIHQLVKNPLDLFNLKSEDLAKLPTYKTKKISNLLQSIAQSKFTTYKRFIRSLGIPGIGAHQVSNIVGHVHGLDKLSLHDPIKIGDITRNHIINWFKSEDNKNFYYALLTVLNFEEELKNRNYKGKAI